MNKTTLDMSAIMASYTQQVIAEEKRRQAIRDGKIQPVQSTNWHISDRH